MLTDEQVAAIAELVAKLAKASAMAADWSEAVTIARLEVEDRNKTIAALKARVAELEEYLTAFRDEKQEETPANAQPRIYTCVKCRANTWSALGTIYLSCHTCGDVEPEDADDAGT
ncbi:MAG: hypothetical protein ACYTAO_22225 [Planctomycetota bacterium]|jgi:hypothetical protein